jgi:hypothetical protein
MGKSLADKLQDVLALVPQAAEWADEHKSAVKVPQDVEPNDKWLARSALQKAIRRGEHDEALSQAARLWKCDPDYCWFALGVIAVEDIGFGDPECVLWSHVGQLKTFRTKLDDGRLLTALVARMCEAVKSRSCCELSIAADWGHQERLEEMSMFSTGKLLDMVQAEDIGESYLAIRLLRGHVPEGLIAKERQEARPLVNAIMMKDLPEPYGLAAWKRVG